MSKTVRALISGSKISVTKGRVVVLIVPIEDSVSIVP